jgi:hypothetical protein
VNRSRFCVVMSISETRRSRRSGTYSVRCEMIEDEKKKAGSGVHLVQVSLAQPQEQLRKE